LFVFVQKYLPGASPRAIFFQPFVPVVERRASSLYMAITKITSPIRGYEIMAYRYAIIITSLRDYNNLINGKTFLGLQ
jgi:hypothetical protein